MLRVPAEPPYGVAARSAPRHDNSLHTESLADLLGGRRGAVDATLPPVAFVVAWLASGESIGVAGTVAVTVAAAVAGWRIRRGAKPRAVVVGLLATSVAAVIALRTGRAADFFLLQVLSNAASALACEQRQVLVSRCGSDHKVGPPRPRITTSCSHQRDQQSVPPSALSVKWQRRPKLASTTCSPSTRAARLRSSFARCGPCDSSARGEGTDRGVNRKALIGNRDDVDHN